MITPLERYHALVDSGQLDADAVQHRAVQQLSALSQALARPRPKSLLQRLNPFARTPARPRGMYLWGGVGKGKTLLMDLFFNNTPLAGKQRVHFHEFMQETHEEIARWRALSDSEKRAHPNYIAGAGDDPLPPTARGIIRKGSLICFDEFHVNDITDAMILGRLFDALFRERAVVVMTSNRHPDDLYKDGLNRGVFLPFIERLKSTLSVVHLDAAKDYRLDRLSGHEVYFTPLDDAARLAMDDAWNSLITGGQTHTETIRVQGRNIQIPRAARGCARFSFFDLCQKPLGAADYLAIAHRYTTILIDDIPQLSADDRNEAKRFVTLIDALYDRNVKLIASAAVTPDLLYTDGSEAFEFERTVSRLLEMQSADYLAQERQ